MFLEAARQLGVPSRACLVFEDAPTGVVAAQAASVPVVALTTSFTTYTESEMTITWPPSPDARTATFVLPPPPVPAATAANASPGNVTPAAPPAPADVRLVGDSGRSAFMVMD